MKIYIAGPMTGIKDFNRDAFYAAEQWLMKSWNKGIFNPARNDEEKHGIILEGTSGDPAELPDFDLQRALHDDTQYIIHEATHLYFLRGWEYSAGATAEHALARALRRGFLYQ